MRLPARASDLIEWLKEIIEECYHSREWRMEQVGMFRAFYWTGANMPGQWSPYNRCFSHIDRLASFLFSPSDVRFAIEFDQMEDQHIQDMGESCARVLNREFHRRKLGLKFAEAVNWALVDGCCLYKQIWGRFGPEAYLVHPSSFGVLREDICDLDQQEAFVHTSYWTKSAFRRIIHEHPRREEILKSVDAYMKTPEGEDEQNYFHQVIIGGTNPVPTTGPTGLQGKVSAVGVPQPYVDPKVAARLIPVHEIWVLDDERQDYTTLRFVQPDVLIEGATKRRNCSGPGDTLPDDPGLKGCHPFVKVAPNDVNGYFWGASEILQIKPLQESLNEQLSELRRLSRLRADPPTVFTGFAGLTLEKWRRLKRPGGFIAEENPNAKADRHIPEIPAEIFTRLDKTVQFFDDEAGFQPILMGQGEQGVRSNAQANTMTRNAAPRMRDRALIVEHQVIDCGDFCLKLLEAKDATLRRTGGNAQFFLDQLPDGAVVTIDSHTSSPAFSEDAERKAFMLAKAGAIDPESLIMLTHPPREDRLVLRAKQKAEAQAKLVAQHPELAFGKKPATRSR